MVEAVTMMSLELDLSPKCCEIMTFGTIRRSSLRLWCSATLRWCAVWLEETQVKLCFLFIRLPGAAGARGTRGEGASRPGGGEVPTESQGAARQSQQVLHASFPTQDRG